MSIDVTGAYIYYTIPIFGGINARIKAHGEILGWAKEIIGRSLAFSVDNTDFIFTEKRSAFIEYGNFEKAKQKLLSLQMTFQRILCPMAL